MWSRLRAGADTNVYHENKGLVDGKDALIYKGLPLRVKKNFEGTLRIEVTDR